MAKRISLPDGSIGEFPDDMADSAIESVLRKQFGKPEPEPRASGNALVDQIPGATSASPPKEERVGTEDLPWYKQGAEGMAAAQLRTARGIGTALLPESAEKWVEQKGLMPTEEQVKEQTRRAKAAGGWGTAGEIAGDMASVGPVGGGAGALATQGARRMLPRAAETLAGRAGLAGAQGAGTVGSAAGMGALVNPEDREAGAMAGGLGGAGGMVLTRALGGLIKPLISAQGRQMAQEGIQPTAGQAMGPAASKFEEKLGTIPLIGDVIRGSRTRAMSEMNDAIARRTAGPAARGGDEGILAMRESIGNVYENALSSVPTLRIERAPIMQAMHDVANDASLGMSDDALTRLQSYVDKHLLNRLDDIDGPKAKALESQMSKLVNKKLHAPDEAEREFGEGLNRILQGWRQSWRGSVAPDVQQQLAQADQAWRGFLPQSRAANYASSAERGGVYSPKVLLQSLKRGDKSQDDNVVNALRQRPITAGDTPYEYAAKMSKVTEDLGDRVPDSGTAGRLLTSALGLGGAAAGGLPAVVGGAAGVGAMAAAYTRIGQRLLQQGVAPESVQRLIEAAQQRGVPPEMLMQIIPGLGRSVAQSMSNSGEVNAAQ